TLFILLLSSLKRPPPLPFIRFSSPAGSSSEAAALSLLAFFQRKSLEPANLSLPRLFSSLRPSPLLFSFLPSLPCSSKQQTSATCSRRSERRQPVEAENHQLRATTNNDGSDQTKLQRGGRIGSNTGEGNSIYKSTMATLNCYSNYFDREF
ncbi:hypothetical protein AABB24_025806, partial [Solanum stoloniferum]